MLEGLAVGAGLYLALRAGGPALLLPLIQAADPTGIVQAAGRLMDLHDRFLELCERCCAVDVPADCTDLHRDVAVLTGLPLQGFDAFIDDFTERVAEMADVARYATGDVELDPVELGVADDGELVTRVSQRLQRLV